MPRPPALLTSQQRREYTQCFVEHGYCVVRGLLSLDEVSVISSALDSLLATSNAVVRAHGPEIAQQLHIRAAARVAERESSGGFSRASQLRAGITTACGANYSGQRDLPRVPAEYEMAAIAAGDLYTVMLAKRK